MFEMKTLKFPPPSRMSGPATEDGYMPTAVSPVPFILAICEPSLLHVWRRISVTGAGRRWPAKCHKGIPRRQRKGAHEFPSTDNYNNIRNDDVLALVSIRGVICLLCSCVSVSLVPSLLCFSVTTCVFVYVSLLVCLLFFVIVRLW